MRSSKIFILIIPFLLSSCTEQFVKKADVKADLLTTKAELLAIQEKTKLDRVDYGSSSEVDGQEVIARSIIEIEGKSDSIKFKDKIWLDYPITLNMNVVPLRTFFNLIGKLTDLNIIVGEEVLGDLSINVKNVNWYEVFELVLKEKNLIHETNKSGTVISVHSHKWVQDNATSFNAALSSKLKMVRSISSLETKTTAIHKLNYSQPETMAQQLSDIVALLGSSKDSETGSRASFVVDNRTNSIIVQAAPNDMGWISSAIENLDKPTKQVMVEVFIVEATNNFQTELGSRLGLFKTAGSSINGRPGDLTATGTLGGTAPTGPGEITTASSAGSVANNPIGNAAGALAMVFTGSSMDLRFELQAMQTESLIKIISNPKLFIIDNEEATITDGVEVPYSTAAAAGATPTTEFKSAALSMKVTPSIIDDGNIYLDIEVKKETPLAGSPPPIASKQIQTKLLIRNKGVAMIGGITKSETSNATSGVPFLKDIPGLGVFFKSKADKNNKDTLYIFIAPEVI